MKQKPKFTKPLENCKRCRGFGKLCDQCKQPWPCENHTSIGGKQFYSCDGGCEGTGYRRE